MLTGLYLRNYILITDLRLAFGPGMTVLTGETGAGKSILVDALNLVFGRSSPKRTAPDPTREVYLEISFSIGKEHRPVLDYLENLGLETEDGELVVAREIAPGGKTTTYLNGRKTAGSVLRDLHELLIDFHHQRDQQNLLQPAFQLDLLDRYGELLLLRNEFRNLFRELKSDLQKQAELQQQEEAGRQLMELYAFQLEELNAASLRLGEDTELEQEFKLQSHSAEIIDLAQQLNQSIYEQEGSIHDTLSRALAQLQKYSDISSGITQLCGSLESCLELVGEISSDLRSLQDKIGADPTRLDEVRQRLDLINALKAKYRQDSIAALLGYRDKIAAAVSSHGSLTEELEEIARQIETRFDALVRKADLLTEKRRQTARKLAAAIQNNVRRLSIPKAQVEIKIDKKTIEKIVLTELNKVYTESGQDEIGFLFSANPGSPVQPLKAIVSGGELSRILLAAKRALADVMPPRTLILDEVDIGIGGRTATTMAEFIHALAADFQVLCITHLAQLAAAADCHVLIEKKSGKDTTAIGVQTLTAENRVNEIARMLSGHITELSLRHACELLEKNRS